MKMRRLSYVVIAIIMARGPVFSQISALNLPGGAENAGLGESGVSHAKNIYTVFYNPASLAALYDETFANIIVGSGHEALLPSLKIPDFYHNATPCCLLLPGILPNVDFAYGYFKNFVNFGNPAASGETVQPPGAPQSKETVTAQTVSLRFFDVLSGGVSFKHFDSQLAPGSFSSGTGEATGNTYDVGMILGKRITLADVIVLTPAIGVSCLNMGGDSMNYHSGASEPLPEDLRYGGSLGLNVLDLFEYTLVNEVDRSMLAGQWGDQVHHYGTRLQFTPFVTFLFGNIDDPANGRFEKTSGYVVSFNFRKTLEMVRKVFYTADMAGFTNYSGMFDQWDKSLTFGPLQLKPNVFVSWSQDSIASESVFHDKTSIRAGQTGGDWTFGAGLVGSFWRKSKM